MTDAVLTSIISAAVGVAFVVVGRLVDRLLPDPEGKHPLPDPPALPKHRLEDAGEGS